MGQRIYYPGGYEPTAKQFNEWQVWDDTTQTYTEYDTSGNVISTRPYNADEVAAYQVNQANSAAQATQSAAKQSLAGVVNQTMWSTLATDLAADIAAVTVATDALDWATQQALLIRALTAAQSAVLHIGAIGDG